ncbi:MAG: sigma 54-interacting transcriptional regulator [Bacteroidota bacterium]
MNNKDGVACGQDIDEERFRNLLEFSNKIAQIGAWDWNLQTDEVLYTNEVARILRASPDQKITAELVFSLCKPDTLERLKTAIRQTIKEGIPFEMKLNTTNLQGKNRYVYISVVPRIFKGQVIRLLGILQDVTAKQEGEMFLEMKAFALEKVGDMVFWVDQKGRIIFVNDAVAEVHRTSKEKLLQKHVWDIAPRVKKEFWEERWDWFRREKRVSYESVNEREDGSVFPVDLRLNFLEFKAEEYICVILSDITERKAKEKELQDALEELKKLKDLLEAENEYLQEDIRIQHSFDEIITISPRYQNILRQVEEVANTNATVLILGETGTGKELLARAIHQLSDRANRVLVRINCAALPSNLIESELFGHERGAFTGADKRKIGRFELADKGTILLDEIGELPLELQAKLLRVLQNGEFSRLGSNNILQADVRVLAATNRDLMQLVRAGKFREDLYYRLNVFPIQNLPLRKRKEDIPVLAKHFMQKYNDKMGKNVTKISQKGINKLMRYNFPGNIRELENIIERSVILSRSHHLNLDHWHFEQQPLVELDFLSFEEMQKQYIVEALKRCEWRVSGKGSAAELLQMNAKTLDSKMRKFGIRRLDYMNL